MALEKEKKENLNNDLPTNPTDNNESVDDNQIKIIIPTSDEVRENKAEDTNLEEKEDTPEQKLKLKMYEIDLKIEECEVKLDELENKILIDPEDYETQDQYMKLKKLEKVRKRVCKRKEGTIII